MTKRTTSVLDLTEKLLEAAPERHADILAASPLDERDKQAALALYRASLEDDPDDPQLTGGASAISRDAFDEPPPEQVGGYRIVRRLGKGGMGEVFLAEREGLDFSHRACIKLIRSDNFPDLLLPRFLQERRLLSRLNHPAIARLYDAGTSETGQPFFVMEFVDGLRLDEWLDERRPGLDTRLDVLEQILEGVGEAHRNLIIHRDLTPGNILVTQENQAKLIDFGISRREREDKTPGDGTDDPGQSDRGGTATPGYGAPEERVAGHSTTRSDIYALGRIAGLLFGDEGEPELDAIAARAAAEAPEDRYASTDAMLQDIRNFRDGDPVAAYSTGRRYRAGKFVGRNAGWFGLAALLFVGLVTALAISLAALDRAATSERLASSRFDDVREIARFMLFDLYDEVEPLIGSTPVREQIADRSLAYLEELQKQPDLPADLRLDIARSYLRLSAVVGNPIGSNLGRRDEARQSLDTAIAMLEQLLRENSGDASARRALAEAMYNDAVLRFIGENDDAGGIESADRSARLYGELLAADPDDESLRYAMLQSRHQAAKPYPYLEKGKEGIARLRKLLPDVAAFADTAQDRLAARRMLGSVQATLGFMYDHAYTPADPEHANAVRYLDMAVATSLGMVERFPDHEDVLSSAVANLFWRAIVYSGLDRNAEALADLDRADGLVGTIIRLDPENKGAVQRQNSLDSQRVHVLSAMGRRSEALAISQRQVKRRGDLLAPQPDNDALRRDLANAQLDHALLADEMDNSRLACRYFRMSHANWQKMAAIAPSDIGELQEYLNPGLAACAVAFRY